MKHEKITLQRSGFRFGVRAWLSCDLNFGRAQQKSTLYLSVRGLYYEGVKNVDTVRNFGLSISKPDRSFPTDLFAFGK